MKLIIGLGNPDPKYQKNRHNVGYMVVDKILENLRLKINKEKFSGIFVKTEEFIIAKPTTYMNLSGDFVKNISTYFKVSPNNILIIYDDMSYEVGQAAIKPKGGSNGQNGIKDILLKMNTEEIPRLKIGIGKNQEAAKHVLSDFTLEEFKIIDLVINQAAEAAISFLFNDIRIVMNSYNK
ncbi:aminoacyl-tRNA hydrolase [[Mycoplasma] mobile]|uniref:Peptidyl-tRNA hydrolase n=1 Tax=Mycoplasma mobile (strain ATCC 43663 / 163K / NCTC 11711) TaxID=267748 RepID=PTH_MYCM1|nr:aminoacyl-tRNA hydrolase [[Mycoplasma] mobile]Q6KHA3.2 RecName: Full=Peptidyl-tRNA hydrolase; Short=PTH [Mycoplasma mobile 163K]